jgi:hypothetical protein
VRLATATPADRSAPTLRSTGWSATERVTTGPSTTRSVRLAAAGEGERIAVLKAAVDRDLRTRRHLDCWSSPSWAADVAPVVDALAAEVDGPLLVRGPGLLHDRPVRLHGSVGREGPDRVSPGGRQALVLAVETVSKSTA